VDVHTAVQLLAAGVTDRRGLHLAAPDYVDTVSFRLGCDPDEDTSAGSDDSKSTEVNVEVWTESLPENYIANEHVRTVSVTVLTGHPTWVDVPADADPGDGQGLFLVFEAAPDVNVYRKTGEYTDVVALGRRGPETGLTSGHLVEGAANEFDWPSYDWVPCFDLAPEPEAICVPEQVTDGYARPFGRPHSWVSELFDAIETDEIRVVVDATNGRRQAEIFKIWAYGPDQWPPLTER